MIFLKCFLNHTHVKTLVFFFPGFYFLVVLFLLGSFCLFCFWFVY